MRKYEVMCVFAPQEDAYQEALKSVKKELELISSEIEKEEDMGVKEIAGKIKKHNHAHYLYFIVKIDPANIVKLRRAFSLIPSLLRSLIINRS